MWIVRNVSFCRSVGSNPGPDWKYEHNFLCADFFTFFYLNLFSNNVGGVHKLCGLSKERGRGCLATYVIIQFDVHSYLQMFLFLSQNRSNSRKKQLLSSTYKIPEGNTLQQTIPSHFVRSEMMWTQNMSTYIIKLVSKKHNWVFP